MLQLSFRAQLNHIPLKWRQILFPSSENVIPFISTPITLICFPVLHSIPTSATCTKWSNLAWWEQPARKKKLRGCPLTHHTPCFVPNRGSLFEGTRDFWDTMAAFTATWHRDAALDTAPGICKPEFNTCWRCVCARWPAASPDNPMAQNNNRREGRLGKMTSQ